MLILQADNIKKYYGERLILDLPRLSVYSGDRIGIVGQNGSGKTTLMNILAGEVKSDEGNVRLMSEFSYIRQFSDEAMEGDPKALKEFNLNRKLNQEAYSGGENTRIKITNALNKDSLLLLADEPTANLDYKGIELFAEKLFNIETFLLISHDRRLLDNYCNKILELREGKARIFEGNYSLYKEQLENELVHKEQEYEKYVSDKTKLENAILDREKRTNRMKKAPSRMGNSEARLHKRKAENIKGKLHNAINSMNTRLEKLEVKEKPKELPQIKLDFSLTNPPENKIVISSGGLNFSYGKNILFKNSSFKIFNNKKTALWGENGCGKTTLLNLIDSGLPDIKIVPRAKIGYFRQGFENLKYDKSILENVMYDSIQNQTVVRTILARLLFKAEDIDKKISLLSGGERIKVGFAKLFVSDSNVLLLDEPTNYLDMLSIEALENILSDYEGTVVFVSHDEGFVNKVANRLLILEDKGIREYEGNIESYREAIKKETIRQKNETDRIIIQMRVTEVLSKLSRPDADKVALEAEYSRLLAKAREYDL